jgi:DNA-binding LytR/AlgR family response regulator
MNKIRCLIVDDEPLAIKLIENHIKKIERLEVVDRCNNAIKAFEILNSREIDLLFLDIKMPSMTGLEFLRTVKHPPKTILTTAYREFALDGYDLEVLDYLLKPITFERFFKAIDRFIRDSNSSNNSKNLTLGSEEFMLIKSGIKHHKVLLDSIVYIESTKDYIRVHLDDGDAIESKYRISAIEEDLKEKGFLRVHRSFIIRTEKIKAFSNHEIDVSSVEIPIGASYREEVSKFLNKLKD